MLFLQGLSFEMRHSSGNLTPAGTLTLYVQTSERETYMVSTFTSVISCRSSLQEVELNSKEPSERSRYLPENRESNTRPVLYLNTCTHCRNNLRWASTMESLTEDPCCMFAFVLSNNPEGMPMDFNCSLEPILTESNMNPLRTE